MALQTDAGSLRLLQQLSIQPYLNDDVIVPYIRGLAPDYDDNGNIIPDSEGTKLYNQFMAQANQEVINGGFPLSVVGKISAVSLASDRVNGAPVIHFNEKDYAERLPEYITKYQSWQALCSIYTDMGDQYPNEEGPNGLKVPGYEYYPDDFIYDVYNGYPMNRLITLRRFPFACTDNIFDPKVQPNQDVTRMTTYIDDNVNVFSELLSFSYGLRWKQLSAGYEAMQMQGADNEGLTGFMNKAAVAFGDEELIKNRLRGPNANQIPPDHDANKAHGPVDSIADTHIRDVGMDFDKEFSIDFFYRARSYGGRNADAVMKDILANILLCTYNDGEFWGGARYWTGARPSKSLNMFQWMNSDDMDTILKGAWNTLTELVTKNFGSKQSAIETLKNVIKGGIKMAMAGILNAAGRPGIPYANSLLSGSPVGSWHLTIGHPMNPIMTIGNLICTGVDVSFPDNTLGYGDFPTTIKATVKLKPAMPLDRAGIEKIFNHGMSRIYMPVITPVVKHTKRSKGHNRSQFDEFIDDSFGKATKVTKQGVEYIFPSGRPSPIVASLKSASKWIGDKTENVWVDVNVWAARGNDIARRTVSNVGEQISNGVKTTTDFTKKTYHNIRENETVQELSQSVRDRYQQVETAVSSETQQLGAQVSDLATTSRRTAEDVLNNTQEKLNEGIQNVGEMIGLIN